MADAGERREDSAPTYYANYATAQLTVDELTLELRRFIPAHREMVKTASTDVIKTAPPGVEQVMKTEPIAKVILTFTAAKSLLDYLLKAFPLVEDSRKTGRPL